MTPEQLSALIQAGLPDAEVIPEDLTGTGDHWHVTVVSARFEGARLIQQHRMVNAAVAEQMRDGTIHALAIKTYTPKAWASSQA